MIKKHENFLSRQKFNDLDIVWVQVGLFCREQSELATETSKIKQQATTAPKVLSVVPWKTQNIYSGIHFRKR